MSRSADHPAPAALAARTRSGPRLAWIALASAAVAVSLELAGERGVRVGAYLLPPFGKEWIVGAVAAVAAFLPALRAPKPREAGAAVVALLALMAVAAEARHRLDHVAPRLRAVVGRSSGVEAPVVRELTSLRLPRKGSVARWFGRADDLRVAIDGVILVPRAGLHRFELIADDHATLRLDDAVLVRVSGRGEASRWLEAGPHRLAIEYEQDRGPARLEVRWDRPALVEPFPLEHYVRRDAHDEGRDARAAATLTAAGGLAELGAWTIALGLLLRVGEARSDLRRRGARAGRAAAAALRSRLGSAAVLTATSAVALLAGLELALRPMSPDGFHFQSYTSEYVMQTVSVADLRLEPFRSLWYDHIQPPAFDLLRALLAATYGGADDISLVQRVDAGLYVVWAVVYGGLAGLVCLWVSRACGRVPGVVASFSWILHPAALCYATVLDSTLLSAALFAWFEYELWRGKDGPRPGRLGAATLALFFTRSAFQWPFVLVAACALLLLRADRRAVARFLLWTAIPVGLFMVKQHALFGLSLTSSFGPDSFCKGLGIYCPGRAPVDLPELPDPGEAGVLRRVAKLDGEYNYNQLAFLRRSFAQRREYREALAQRPAMETARAFLVNARIFLRPSSRYTTHVIVDRLPWRALYDAVFSGGPLLALLALGVLGWGRGRPPREWARGIALALPVLYVVAVTIVFERGENHRYKFFVEPVLDVFLAAQAAHGVRAALAHARRALRK